MKKLGLVCVTNYNFGSILQTFALQQTVRRMGYSTEIVAYHEPFIAKIGRLRNKEYAINKFKGLYKSLCLKFLRNSGKVDYKERERSFKNFIIERFAFSRLCTSKSQLTQLAMEYESIILGSDQVWHPVNIYMDFFTLNFVPESINKIAYAPSFGVSQLPTVYKNRYCNYINRFQHLSAREEQGVKLISELTGREAAWVCDPTILLTSNDWNQFLSDKIKYNQKYIFCYFIGNNPKQRKLARQFANSKGLKVLGLLHIDQYIKDDELYVDFSPYNVGPSEFLYLLHHAEFVFTDSFHATVFSLLFHRSFYVFNRFANGKGTSTTSRIDSLLKIANTHDRMMKDTFTINDLNSVSEIDFRAVDKKLQSIRELSLSYLAKSLS